MVVHFSRLKFPEQRLPQKRKLPASEEEGKEDEGESTLLVEPYTIPNRGPYPYNQPKKYGTVCVCT